MKNIISFIIKEFEGLVSNKKDFTSWINECAKYDDDSKRLLYCIAIEIKHELADKQLYIDIFNNIDYISNYKPQLKFENVFNVDNPDLHFFSKEESKNSKKQYCGLLKLEVFGIYYLDKNYKDDEIDYLREKLENNEFDEVLIDLNTSVKPREVSWVTLNSIIDKLQNHAKKQNLNVADYICDKLGLYWDHMNTPFDPKPEWIKLIYPIKMEESFYQPISVNADWKTKNGQFISYKRKDKMGRTRSNTKHSSYLGIKEAIHYKIDKQYFYSAFYIEKIENSTRNIETILDTAKSRFYE